MNRPGLQLLALLLLASFIIAGCTNDPVFSERGVHVSAKSLPRIAGNGYYELWFSYPHESSIKGPHVVHEDDNYFSVGRFKVDESGAMTGINGGTAIFTIPTGYNPQLLIDAILTVQSPGDSASTPGPRMLAGAFSGTQTLGTDTLRIDDGEAFSAKISQVTSSRFILDAGTSNNPADQTKGIWFVTVAAPGDTVPGVWLPNHPVNPDNPDWRYQAWLTHSVAGSPVEYLPLGRFSTAKGLDSNGAGPGAGTLAPRYNTPGEDFVTGATRTLNDGTYGVLLSLEPVTISLSRPLVTLLKLDTIPPGYAPRSSSLELAVPDQYPEFIILVDR